MQKLLDSDAKKIFNSLNGNVRFVGGCVRDYLLEKPLKDIDLATPYPPEKVMELLEKHKIRNIPTGLQHGTITAVINKKTFEITTLRRDEACDGRHAKVSFTDDWKEDAARRDFTINALYLDEKGKIYDYFGGQKDLKARKVRFIGNAADRITEDYLRILRFYRFSAQYAKKLDKTGVKACSKLAPNISKLSGERINTEMLKLLASKNPQNVLQTMEKTGVATQIFPHELTAIRHLGDVENENNRKDFIPDSNFRLAYLLSFTFLNKAEFKVFAERWKLSNQLRASLEKVIFFARDVDLKTTDQEAKTIIRALGKELSVWFFRIQLAKNIVKTSKLKKNKLIKHFAKFIKLSASWKIPLFPVSGDDLIKLGFKPGKTLGEALKFGEIWWEKNSYKPTKALLLKHISSYK